MVETETKEDKSMVYDHITKENIPRSTLMKSLYDKFQTIIAGETVTFDSYEYFFKGTPGKVKDVLDITETQTYMKAVRNKVHLSPGQKIAIGVIVTVVMLGIILLAALKGMGILNF